MNIDSQMKLVKDLDEGTIKPAEMDQKFNFSCTGCGKCCFSNDIVINTYDMIRLRHALKMTTKQILDDGLINIYLGPVSGLPVASINFRHYAGDLTKCPFLSPAIDINDVLAHLKEKFGSDEAKMKEVLDNYKKDPSLFKNDMEGVKISKWLCAVHEDRPIICRLFPCGRIQRINKENEKIEENYILQDSEESKEFCPGWESTESVTVSDFLTGQRFWQSKEGSDVFSKMMTELTKNGIVAKTDANKNNTPEPTIGINNSKELLLIGNLLYNFDSFDPFAKDPRVVSTITDNSVLQVDFMYVMNKVYEAVKDLVNEIKKVREGVKDNANREN